MSTYDLLAFVLRDAALFVWAIAVLLTAAGKIQLTYIRSILMGGSLVALLAAIVYGGAVPIGLAPGEIARTLYTAIATAILIAGLTYLTPAGQP